MQEDSSDSSDDLVRSSEKYQAIFKQQLKKKQALQLKKREKEMEKRMDQLQVPIKQEDPQRKTVTLKPKHKEELEVMKEPRQIRWYIYPKCPPIDFSKRVPSPMNTLPIYKKKDQILDAITKNQFVLVTGETGCGKSTQVPRLIYEYLQQIGDNKSKIMCVQPRRLAVLNLTKILGQQMKDPNRIGYQIGMKNQVNHKNKIMFVTNGIFLQRIVHSTKFFKDYPFILLDQVHERDIDTDFILLAIKRLIRLHPRVRIILMSATIDNDLFRYYFASDHVDNILNQGNFYTKIIQAKADLQQKKKKQRQQLIMDEQNLYSGFQIESDSRDEDKIYQEHNFSFMNSKHPCPAINVTEPGKFKRTFLYLDTLRQFLSKNVENNRWGSVIFQDKYPAMSQQLYQSVVLILDEVIHRNRKKVQKSSILVFMPGLAEIQQLSQYIRDYFKPDKCNKYLQILNVHSSILSDHITSKLHEKTGTRHKVIIATNIAQSSITVLGVQYVIDFCLSKEVVFDLKSKMESLALVWASKASCNQRAGRTGRVCDGVIIRMVEKKFYQKLPAYSTPQIQRSSLDKVILRIKLLHEGEESTGDVFQDPGEVLGSAIQPPNIRNISTSVESLIFSGGLQSRQDQTHLTALGRLYIDIPIDIAYCKLLIVSQLFGTYQDMLTLVSILSQSKNAIRRGTIDRDYKNYYNIVSNSFNCDFLGLLNLYEKTIRDRRDMIRLQVLKQVETLKSDINRRIKNKQKLFPLIKHQEKRSWKLIDYRQSNEEHQEYLLRFKITLTCGFIQNMLRVRQNTLEDKQQKRLKIMKRTGISHKNTVCILNCNILRMPGSSDAEKSLKETWVGHIRQAFGIKDVKYTLTYGLAYLHFEHQDDLHKFLFYKYMEQSKRKSYYDERLPSKDSFLPPSEIFRHFGETDHMHPGSVVTWKQSTVFIDNYSLNRVVNINEGADCKFLVTNNIAKQSSRMISRYTSLLPMNIKFFQAITSMLFYPFVSLSTTRDRTRYDYLVLSKRRHKMPVRYSLSNKEVQQANQIRLLLRQYLSLKEDNQIDFSFFQAKMLQFIFKERREVIQQQKWQEIYMKELFDQYPKLKEGYKQFRERRQAKIMDVEPDNSARSFINPIKTMFMGSSYFTEEDQLLDTTLKERIDNYNLWKQSKLKQVRNIERKGTDQDSYLACGQESCGIKICPMIKVSPIADTIYRQLFSYDTNNVVQLPDTTINNHFSSSLLSNYIDFDFRTFGCANGHSFAILVNLETKLKILPFSNLLVIYPDGSAEQADFHRMDIKDWKPRHDQKSRKKYEIKLSTYCFVCDETLTSFKALENHIRDTKHSQNVTQFSKTLPESMRIKPAPKQDYDDGSMY